MVVLKNDNNKMKHVKLFENFVNEAKARPSEFYDTIMDQLYDYEETYLDGEEMSSAHIAEMLTVIWEEVAEQNNFHHEMYWLNDAFREHRVKMTNVFSRGRAYKDLRELGSEIYDMTGFNWDGMIECFRSMFGEAGISKATGNKIVDYLNDDSNFNESVVNERLSKSELNKIEDFIEGLDRPELFEICDEFYIEDDQFQANKHDLDDDDLRMYAMEYIESEDIKFKDVKAMVS